MYLNPPLCILTITTTTEIYTLSLHDALPIYANYGEKGLAMIGVSLDRSVDAMKPVIAAQGMDWTHVFDGDKKLSADRKSTRLNSSHSQISYAVFCLKKKRKDTHTTRLATMGT